MVEGCVPRRFVYGLIFCYGESGPLLVGLAFPIIALSKQLVYSSIFHCIGAEFGFGKYGTLLGIINVLLLRGCSADESRRRRGCDVDIPWTGSVETGRGDAAAATWIFRGDRCTQVTVAAFGLVQYPLVSFSTNAESYAFANWFLLLLAGAPRGNIRAAESPRPAAASRRPSLSLASGTTCPRARSCAASRPRTRRSSPRRRAHPENPIPRSPCTA